MKTFQLNAEPRTYLGKKAAKAIRKENKIPVVLNGGKLIQFAKNEAGEWICNEKLEAGQKAVEILSGDYVSSLSEEFKLKNTYMNRVVDDKSRFMEKLQIIGNLTRDPELRVTQTGVNVCTFTVAVNQRPTKAQR